MRSACGAALAAIGVFVCSITSTAQTYPNGLSADSATPSKDSVFFRQVRCRMDSIRTTLHRPTVGLVLSGGGAKGAAEVGVLKYIEELGIPIDLVCGTSIGGLIGGLYSVGYTPDDMQELFTTQDWSTMLTDYIKPSYLSYSTKMRSAKYLITIPFRTAGEVLDFGDKNRSFTSSLPSGYADGFNVNNLLSSLTVGYQDSISFSTLPVPYMCVASDMVSCKAKNWGSGELKTAMRSTMSIPGLFDPVRTEGMVLVDGGTRNNFPTDIAKAMGADYVIGIELSDSRPSYEEVNNIGDIIWQFMNMLGNDAFDKNIHIPDVMIKPTLKGYNMMSFSVEAIDTMIVRGYNAAAEKKDELLSLKQKLDLTLKASPQSKATDIGKTPVEISEISFNGLSDKEIRMVSKLIEFEEGDKVGKADLDRTMSKLLATGAFSSLTYSLLGKEEPFSLVFNCVTAPTNSLSLGARMDTEEWASLLFNLGINTNSLRGSRFNLTAKLGQNLKAEAHYAFDFARMPTINLSASISRYKGNLGSAGDNMRFDVTYWTHKEMLYLTDIRWTKVNFKAGIKNQYIDLDESSYLASLISELLSKDALHGSYVGAFTSGHYYTFDDYYYPSRGTSLEFSCNYDFLKLRDPSFSPAISLGVDLKTIIPIGRKFAIIPDFHFRNVINTGEKTGSDGHRYKDLSVLHTNFVGGSLARRYTENQVPFFGVNNITNVDEYLQTATIEFRLNPAKKFYVSAMAGLFESNDDLATLIVKYDPDCYAFGLEAAYNFVGGPVKFNVHWANAFGWGVYASIGFDF